ncbi:BTAD domain-containing putative transcriptional regulator [Spirillospora sp. CA-142024]|uniref:BTAD domain-containing putative transcriptional regulator n=1 Tax=Spirillospora sp. CA-142024 TaxID=3240036 RepID=UPI003D8A580A
MNSTFSVLGPVEARVNGREAALGGGRQRALLALLLLSADRVVSVDRLVDELWGEVPPKSARPQVHTLVHRVRRALGDASGLLETRPAGYLLRTGSATVDLPVFTGLVERARRAAAAGQADDAASTFREALAQWRGPALVGAEAAFVPREAARLEELRLVALEECLDVELALGRHGAVVAELASLVDEHPLREKLRAGLMLALYRCGRRPEALQVYRDGRALLIEETGLEPTERLRRLHEGILRGEVEPPPLEPEPPGPPVPAREPAPVPDHPPTPGPEPAPVPEPGRIRASAPGRRRVRVRGLGIAVALVALSGLGGASAGWSGREAGGPSPSDRQWVAGPAWVNVPPRPVRPVFFGATIGTNSGAMPGFRVGSVRAWDSETRWSDVQPGRGRFDWAPLDRMVAGAAGAGLPVAYTMGMTPAWAAPNGPRSPYVDDSRTAPPRDLADWDRYVRALVARYRGRIEAYELWDYPNTRFHYSGDVSTMVEMTRRASAIIRAADPRATIVCPSVGDLWEWKGRRWLARFAALGGFRSCDVVAVKLHPRQGDGRPEEMTELATLIYNTLHNQGVHLPMWATGPAHSIPTVPALKEADANNRAVRYYLAGLYARFERMYFYSWGVRNLPLVLQVEGSPPTRAALFIQRLQRWLDGARIRSCGQGQAVGLPQGAWQCRFQLAGDGQEGAVRWMAKGTAEMPAEPGAYRIDHLDGRTVTLTAGDTVRLTERPVLVRSALG